MYPVKDKQADVKAQEATFHEAKRSVEVEKEYLGHCRAKSQTAQIRLGFALYVCVIEGECIGL